MSGGGGDGASGGGNGGMGGGGGLLASSNTAKQGLTLVHFTAQRKLFPRDRECVLGYLEGD
jgi:hypothetical protein